MKRVAGRGVIVASRDVFLLQRLGAGSAVRVVCALCPAAVLGAAALLAPAAAAAADMNAVNHATQIASGVGAGSAVPALGVGAVLQTLVGLAVVIGLVFGCAWLARRFGVQSGQRGGLVKTVGGASLGGKERVAVVEIGDTWLVLGAAPGNVRLLHTMPAGAVAAEAVAGNAAPLSGSFGQRFRDALKGEVGKRFNAHGGGER
ncbi:flagellar biosynthetic protein FliO [Paraburkholderia sp. MMS20-SJTR3]|uniref:Flagellar protein n=1 Tax=Paraburkholderia sejongensis TaxID=2886946 RepID=A0ABS8JTG3_9BURK|nr:flagellar biosynthetic protein FliO [Paraburkholderia sp. MMS20-SJTR3]MCC8393196.1 flagellar biosynthetic protein FliO [Paraburkholderia sp. MMS20-SJTR3]